MRYGGAICIGAARGIPLNAGDLVMTLKDELNVPESAWRAGYAEVFEQPQTFPSQSVLIAADGELMLVDVGDYAATVPADSPWLPPGYAPPPGIAEQIVAMGFALADVRRVVITHAHWDHFAGTTRRENGEYAPTFANAEYLLGRADWESAETQAALADPGSLENRTLGVLNRVGALRFVDGDRALSDSVSVVWAPGESPGHHLVRVASEEAVLYCVGDLFHATVEVEHPEWMATWAEPAAMLASRERFIATTLREGAELIAAHIAGVGRLEATATGARWVTV